MQNKMGLSTYIILNVVMTRKKGGQKTSCLDTPYRRKLNVFNVFNLTFTYMRGYPQSSFFCIIKLLFQYETMRNELICISNSYIYLSFDCYVFNFISSSLSVSLFVFLFIAIHFRFHYQF